MWGVLRYLIGLALAGIALEAVFGKRDELSGASSYLNHVNWAWIVLAIVSEGACLVAFGLLQRRLLAAGRLDVSLRYTTTLTLAAYSIQNSLPGGPAWSGVYAFRQFRKRGASDALAAWTLIVGSLLSQVTLVMIAAVGLAVAGGNDSGLRWVIVTLVGFAALSLWLWRHRELVERATLAAIRLSQRVIHRPGDDAADRIHTTFDRLAAISPTRTEWAWSTTFAALNWLGDAACLAVAYLAVGVAIPWRGLLLAYGAAQLAANLPITPGGLGVVEGSLTIALVAYGGSHASTVAAVLLYRLVSFWLPLPIGWSAGAALAIRDRRDDAVPSVEAIEAAGALP